MFTLNCKGKLITTEIPLVMGIINVTPDSFYNINTNDNLDEILFLAQKMITEGADIIDVGGQSTKPNSDRISIDEELNRVIPVIEKIHAAYPDVIISVDTYQSKVAIEAVNAGASIVNDVSAGELDNTMIATVGKMKNVPFVCMHMRGTPNNMQAQLAYDDILKELLDYFENKINLCKNAGITDIIIDPGFGFAKNTAQNFLLLKQLSIFKMLDRPILAGISRKSMIYKTLNCAPAEALNGTSVLNTLALLNGANILRVHDVKEAKEAIRLVQQYKFA
jgi:dihydropteroate synthase